MFAGIVNLCASQLPSDQFGFGWINPTLYLQKNQDLFHDIIGGNNQNNMDQPALSCPPYPSPGNSISSGDDLCQKFNVTAILNAYLKYNGAYGDKVFITISSKTSDGDDVFVSRNVTTGESISFGYDITYSNPRPLSSSITINIMSPIPGQAGNFPLHNATVSTSCPGPWTIDNTIAGGLVVKGVLAAGEGEVKLLFDSSTSPKESFGFEATPGWVRKSGNKYTM